MKGVVFTEFIEMVEEKFGPEPANRMIVESSPASGGAYTAVGTYDHQELVGMVQRLSKLTGAPASSLVRTFGRHLFKRFTVLYPRAFANVTSAFDLLARIDQHIHVEVLKLYPDAELPRFECRLLAPDQMELIYRSARPFADLAEGLMEGCREHFDEPFEIQREELPRSGCSAVRFVLTHRRKSERSADSGEVVATA